MQYGHVNGIDKPISRLVQGTVMISSKEPERSFQLMDEVFAAGCTAFDSAHVYGGGDCERTLGRWIQERGVRDKVVVLTKGAHHSGDRKRVTPFDISSDLHDSLARLKSDYIDLYVLHRDDPDVPVGPIVEVLNEHREAGKIRAFGGSNWTADRIRQANEYALSHGLTGFAVSSPNFSLAVQAAEPWGGCISISGPQGAADREYYQRTKTPLFTWSSLAGGFFSGRFRRDNLDGFTAGLDKLCVKCYCTEENFRRLDRAAELGREKGLTLPQVATAYVLSQPLNIFALVGCANGQEYRDNAKASALKLTAQEIAWLELKSDGR